MLQTQIPLINLEKIDGILKRIVRNSYEEAKREGYLLCMECGDVDVNIAVSNDDELQEAINENFTLNVDGDIEEEDVYQQLMDDLFDYFVVLNKDSGYFDYFPEGIYEVGNEKRKSDTDMLAPKGYFYAPFEDATTKMNK